MNEEQYHQKLNLLIKDHLIQKRDINAFRIKALALGKEFDKENYHTINEFKNKQLGWAKYWIEEMKFYGTENVIRNHFDFIEFANQTNF